MKLDTQGLKHIAWILMGAAHVDGDYDGSEAEAIGDILRDLVGDDRFPAAISDHLDSFDADGFDLEASCNILEFDSARDRKALLALITRVTDADDVLDLEESNYIRRVADFIGAEPNEFADSVMEVEFIEPPPTPKS